MTETTTVPVSKPPLAIVILAAGQGTRMLSDTPKVLHPLAAKPLLTHVIDTAMTLVDPTSIYVVYGHGGERIRESYLHTSVHWVLQTEQLGTGHAVNQVMPHIADDARLLVLCGDVPLLTPETLSRLVTTTPDDALGLLTAEVPEPRGLGRIVRDANRTIEAIVEERDADAPTRAIREIYSGVMIAPAGKLRAWLARVDNHNDQGEYYLTSIVALAIAEGIAVVNSTPEALYEIAGVNDRSQLAELERIYQHIQAKKLAKAGVTIADLNRIDIRGEVRAARDSFIDVGVILQGKVILGEGCHIGPYCVLTDVEIAPGAQIRAHSVVEGAKLGAHTIVGPFARVRPGTVMQDNAMIGNFVEVKNTTLGYGAKASHLSYLGDATIGQRVNIGAGTITCNYDGVNKHKTIIDDDAFIGSNTSLVAPIHVGRGATLGAGSTVSKDVPSGQLTVARAKAVSLANWQRPQKQKMDKSDKVSE